MNDKLKSFGTFIGAIALALFIKGFFIDFHLIPTGSMIPTIKIGDRVIVNRFHFGFQNPLYNVKQKKSIMLVIPNPLYKLNLPLSNHKYIWKFNTPIHRYDVLVFFPPEQPVLGPVYHYPNDPDRKPTLFYPPSKPGERYVKRVIGLPGETLELKDGYYYINGEKLVEPFKVIRDDPESYLPTMPTNFGPIIIPKDHYFMSGDNRPFSSDSRVWGVVPSRNYLGKAWYIVWPLEKFKKIR